MAWFKLKCRKCDDNGLLFGFAADGSPVSIYCLCEAGKAERLERVPVTKAEPDDPPIKPLSPADKVFQEWLENQPFGEIQRGHMIAAWGVVTGKRKCPPGFTVGGLREQLNDAGAPMPSDSQ